MNWQRQRGAAAVFAALAIVAAVSAFSLVFHAAQLYLAKRDLQRITNMKIVCSDCVEKKKPSSFANGSIKHSTRAKASKRSMQ